MQDDFGNANFSKKLMQIKTYYSKIDQEFIHFLETSILSTSQEKFLDFGLYSEALTIQS